MSITKMAVAAVAAVAVFSITTTEFSDGINPAGTVVTAQERGAYEAATGVPEKARTAADRILENC